MRFRSVSILLPEGDLQGDHQPLPECALAIAKSETTSANRGFGARFRAWPAGMSERAKILAVGRLTLGCSSPFDYWFAYFLRTV